MSDSKEVKDIREAASFCKEHGSYTLYQDLMMAALRLKWLEQEIRRP